MDSTAFVSRHPQAARLLRAWIPLAAAVTALSGLVYLGVQQGFRMGMDDPQVQIAEDGARLLEAGTQPSSLIGTAPVGTAPADMAKSLTTFIIVVGADDGILWASATLAGRPVKPPPGVLRIAREAGRNAVTWQPAANVRIASVSVSTGSGMVVVAGRNMREIERRIVNFGRVALMAWFATLLGLVIAVWVAEFLFGDPRHDSRP